MTRSFNNARAQWRDRRRLASARRAIKRAERSLARRKRVGSGYDELLHPAFLFVMGLALAALVMV